MDAAGAAIATVTAQALSVVFAIVILIKKELPFKITRKDFGLNSQCKKFFIHHKRFLHVPYSPPAPQAAYAPYVPPSHGPGAL